MDSRNEKNDVFSVIVLCYQNAELLPECLDTILLQEYPAIELIVADDKSDVFDIDKFNDYISEKKAENVLAVNVYQNEKNLGTVANINVALKKCSGKYIKIIAADDKFYDKNVLQYAAHALEMSSDGIVTGDVIKCNAEMKNPVKYPDKLQRKLNEMTPKKVFKSLCVHNGIIAGGVFFERRFFEKYGNFDEGYRLMEDWPMWLKVTKKGCKILYHPFNTICYRANGGIGTGINPSYMLDKKRVLYDIIVPAKKEIGLITYLKARLSFKIRNSLFIRKLYGKIFRKGK